MSLDEETNATPQHGAEAGGFRFVDRLAAVARDAGGLVFNRIELAALELGELRGALLRLLLTGALAIVALWFAVAWWSVLVVYLAWDSLGWKVLVLVAAVFTGLAWWLMKKARAIVDSGQIALPATMSELRRDKDALL